MTTSNHSATTRTAHAREAVATSNARRCRAGAANKGEPRRTGPAGTHGAAPMLTPDERLRLTDLAIDLAIATRRERKRLAPPPRLSRERLPGMTRRGIPVDYAGDNPQLCNAITTSGRPCRALGIVHGRCMVHACIEEAAAALAAQATRKRRQHAGR